MELLSPNINEGLHEDDPTVSIVTTRLSEEVHLYSLILSAANIDHTIGTDNVGGWSIEVAREVAPAATGELTSYAQENRNWPPAPPAADSFVPFFKAQSILIAASLLLFHAITGPWSPNSLWFTDGSIDSEKIIEQWQVFRLITALTLHADLVHVVGNALLGGVLLHFFFLLLGNGYGFFLIIASAGLANWVNVLAHGSGHHAVGFSTAVFAVIGMLSALNYRHYRFTRPGRLLLPLMAGAAMLAMLGSGSGDGRTDLGAHFFGLLSGLAAGTIVGLHPLFRLRENSRLQSFLWLTSAAIVVTSWKIALR